ncbi:MAG TPA: hypothetical protein VF756_32405 [Thermoanaerobaculia bacterium]
MPRRITAPLVVISVVIGGFYPSPTRAARHWFTEEDRFVARTDLFEASVGRNSFCDPMSQNETLQVQLRFLRGDDEFRIADTPAYHQIIRSVVAPAIHAICGNDTDLVIYNYFAKRIERPNGAEVEASRVIFNFPPPGDRVQVQWVWFDAVFAGTGPLSFTTQHLDAYYLGDKSLTTLKAIRAWLSQGSAAELIARVQKVRSEREKVIGRMENSRQAAEEAIQDLLAEQVRLGEEAYRSQWNEQSYRTGIKAFAEACEKGSQRGCVLLSNTLPELRDNCRGRSVDREAKPWVCGLYGFALEKAPILEPLPWYLGSNYPQHRDHKLIDSLYREACGAGVSFYCELLKD